MRFLENAPRFVFFTGKGGVGKTSIACATAVRLAFAGHRVLLVSTDPASNVGQVFGIAIGNTLTPVPSMPTLAAVEIDPEQAVDAYRERIIGPGVLRIASPKLLLDLGIATLPEARKVRRYLLRAIIRTQQVEQ